MEEEIIVEFEIDKYGQEVRIDRYDHLRHHSNGALYAFMVRPVADLDTLVPEGVKGSTKNEVFDDDGNLISSDQKNVLEFVGGEGKVHRLNEYEVIIPACALNPNVRQSRVNKNDLDDWKYYGRQEWGEFPAFLTIAERNALLPKEG